VSHPVSCTIDLGADGKQTGELRLPTGADGALVAIPIATIANGHGPTVLVSGGTHGDEYEGQIAARRLVSELQPEQVSGRVVVIPVISTEASKAHSRFWPSGANFNRSFPGRLDGPPDEVLAHFFTTVLFPLVDVLVEMHSGGAGALIVPCSHMCAVDDLGQRRAMLAGMEAWNSDVHFLYTAGDNYLPTIAQAQGKVVITTELGGGGRVPAPVHRLAYSGLTNVLRHVGVLEGEVQTRASLGREPAVILDGRDPANIVVAPEDGLFEALLEPGDPVAAGQTVGRLWFVDRPDRPPVEIPAPLDGYVAVTKAIPVTEQGDCVFVLGQPIDRADLL
jgi:N-alpha-acetyl-L-2,4-diaminobutyrate deacetylase